MALGEGLAQILVAEEPNSTTLWKFVQLNYLKKLLSTHILCFSIEHSSYSPVISIGP